MHPLHQQRELLFGMQDGQILLGHIGHGHPAACIFKGGILGEILPEDFSITYIDSFFGLVDLFRKWNHGLLEFLQRISQVGQHRQQAAQKDAVLISSLQLICQFSGALSQDECVGDLHAVGSEGFFNHALEYTRIDIAERFVFHHQCKQLQGTLPGCRK